MAGITPAAEGSGKETTVLLLKNRSMNGVAKTSGTWPSDAWNSLLWAVSVLHGGSRKSQTRKSDIDSRRPILDVHETIQKSSYAVYT